MVTGSPVYGFGVSSARKTKELASQTCRLKP